MHNEETDEQLLERISQHDGDRNTAAAEAAFELLFTRHYQRVYRLLYNLVRCREQAEDLAQETFLALYHSPPCPGDHGGVGAWLCRVALNRGYNALRSERRARQRAAAVGEMVQGSQAADDPHTDVTRAEERARVRALLDQLPERQSKLLLLRYAGFSYGEIAAALNVAPGSVGTLLARAERAFGKLCAQEPFVGVEGRP